MQRPSLQTSRKMTIPAHFSQESTKIYIFRKSPAHSSFGFMHYSHNKWISDEIELPCLQDGLDPNAGPWAYRGDEHTYSPVETPGGIWYYDNRGIRVVEKGVDFIHLETLYLKNNISHRIEFEDIAAPDVSSDQGEYVQTSIVNEDCPLWLSRVNPCPTLFLSFFISYFVRSIGRAIVDLNPEVLAGDKFADRSSWASGETKWIYRRTRGHTHNGPDWFIETRPNEPYSDLNITGELASGLARTVAKLIRDEAVPGLNPKVLELFPGYWEKLAYNLRISKGLPAGTPRFSLGATDCLEHARFHAFHAKDLYLFAEADFDSSLIRQYAEASWELAEKLLVLKDVIEKTKEENCLDKSKIGRFAIVCRFAQGARERIRKIQGKEYRDFFESESWIENHVDIVSERILEFQLNNEGSLFHIDHIVPLAALPHESWRSHDSLAWHPCNLQILTAKENVSKSSFYLGKRLTHKNYDKAIGVEAIEDLNRRHRLYMENLDGIDT